MLIDTHVHIGGEAVGFEMTEEKVIEAVKKYGIDHIVLSNADSGELDHSQKVLPEKYLFSQEDSLKRAMKFITDCSLKCSINSFTISLTL